MNPLKQIEFLLNQSNKDLNKAINAIQEIIQTPDGTNGKASGDNIL